MNSSIPLGCVCLLMLFTLLALFSLHTVRKDEQAVLFILGRIARVRGPGIYCVLPLFCTMIRLRQRTLALPLPPQKIITHDKVIVFVSALLSFSILDPGAAVLNVADFMQATLQVSLVQLHTSLGRLDMSALFTQRSLIEQRLPELISERTAGWGIRVTAITLQAVNQQSLDAYK